MLPCEGVSLNWRSQQLPNPEPAIGITLTSAWQLVLEASTSAIIVHHPAAMYYMVKV